MPGLSIATHFSNDHSTDQIKITGINPYKGPDHIRKDIEQRIIMNSALAIQPGGSNASFTALETFLSPALCVTFDFTNGT